ncbi:TetR/AcrR family transcriptional regulator [Corynebacterium freneyi]|uniref:TetR/AcrR family transcriptional regulator n=1 Tax=Corynebacterium freneyi TaxID=134034 RepID=UPI001EF257B0|nr:TetR/AcrR family transcriptional regulator [Corynebacterium freneyi]MCG7437944.1 TetR/AcrR family transcriptional regulator [Corynebacterium freneyi]
MSGLREQKKLQTKNSLATAAVALLVAEGDEGATVAAIASRAGVSTRTFHNYFAAREDAFLHFIEEKIDGWEAAMRSAPAEQSPFEVLRDIIVAMYDRPVEDIASVPNLVTVAEHVIVGLGPDGGDRAHRIFRGLRGAIVERSGGGLSPFEAQTLIHMCLSASSVVFEAVRDGELAAGRTTRQMLDDAFSFISAGID